MQNKTIKDHFRRQQKLKKIVHPQTMVIDHLFIESVKISRPFFGGFLDVT